MADQLSLEILIKTALQGRGIQATADEVKQLTQEIDKATPAGQAYNTSADDLAKKLDGIRKAAGDAKPPLDGAGDAAKKTGAAAQQTGKQVQGLGRDFNDGAAAGRILIEVLSGNFSQIGQLGTAVKGLGTVLKTNLIGTLVTLGAVAAQFVVPFIAGFTKAKKPVEELVEEINRAKELSKALGDAKLDAYTQEIQRAQRAMDLLIERQLKKLELDGKAAEAEAALKRAAIDADNSLTATEKAQARSAIDADLVKQQRAREDQQQQIEVQKSDASVRGAQKTVDARKTDVDAAQKASVDANKLLQQRAELEDEIAQIKNQLALLTAGSEGPLTGEAATKQSELTGSLVSKQRSLDALPSLSELNERVSSANTNLDNFGKALEAAKDQLLKVKAENDSLRAQVQEQKPEIEKIRKTEDKTREISQAKSLSDAARQDAAELAQRNKQQAELQKQLSEAQANKDAVGIKEAQSGLRELAATNKPGLAGADARLADIQQKEALDASQSKFDENTKQVVQNTAAFSNLHKSINAAAEAAAPRKTSGGTIIKDGKTITVDPNATPAAGSITKDGQIIAPVAPSKTASVVDQGGRKIDVTSGSSVSVDRALNDFYAPLDAASSTVTPVAPASSPAPVAPDKTQQVLQQSQASVDSATQKIGSTQAPPPLDLAPLAQAQQQFATAVLQSQAQSKAQLESLAKQVALQAQQISQLAESIA